MTRGLVLLAFALALALQPACVIFDDASGFVAVSWVLRTASGAEVECIPGEEVHVLVAGTRSVFDCRDFTGTSAPVPAGSYDVDVELYTADGTLALSQRFVVRVFNGAVSDVGPVEFIADSGSVTISWVLRQYTTSAPAERCQPGEEIYIEIAGSAPFTVDCFRFDNQPITGLLPGRYDAYIALLYEGVIEDDPRPGFGDTELNVSFDILPNTNTDVVVEFIVATGPAARSPSR